MIEQSKQDKAKHEEEIKNHILESLEYIKDTYNVRPRLSIDLEERELKSGEVHCYYKVNIDIKI